MKKVIFIFTIILFANNIYSANIEKQYKKLIEKLDVAEEVKNVKSNKPSAFWEAVINNNASYAKFLKDIKKNKGAEKEALNKIAQIYRYYPEYDGSIIEKMQGFCDTLMICVGIDNLGINCSLHVVSSYEVNAYTVLTEKGFAMCLTTGLISLKNLTYEMLMGYVAHEFVHGALLHQVRAFYAQAKERRKNQLWGGIAIALNGFAAGMESYNAAAYGIPTSGINYGANIANIGNDIKTTTLKYSFKYSREQEFEADLIAFRFLEHLGLGYEFIRGLYLLGTTYDQLYNDYSDHPTTKSRIDFLKYVQAHPDLGNKDSLKKHKSTK